MQTSFYTFSTSNNPLLGNVTIGSYHSLNNKNKKTTTTTINNNSNNHNNKYPNNTIKFPLSTKTISTLTLQPPTSTSSSTQSKKINRFSFQTQSSHSEEEIKTPITPKSLQNHLFDINHHDETFKSSILPHSSTSSPSSSHHQHSLIYNIQQLNQQQEQQYSYENKKEDIKKEIIDKKEKNNYHHHHNGYDSKNRNDETLLLCDNKDEKSILNNADVDDFEMIRSKITGITRAMQAFHVQELLFDHEPNHLKKNNNNNNNSKNKHKNYHLTPDQPMCNPLWKDQKKKQKQIQIQKKEKGDKVNQEEEVVVKAIKDKNKIESSFFHITQSQHHSLNTTTTNNNNDHDEIVLNNTQTTLLSTQLTDREASDIYSVYNQHQQHSYPAITPTTSTTLDHDSLPPPLHTYMLTPQQSASSSTNTSTTSFKENDYDRKDDNEENDFDDDLDDLDDDEEEEEEMDEQWQQQFLSLMGNIVKQSEQLEWLSTDLLRAESHVRQLLSIASTVQDQFEEREKQYEERLKEVHVAGQQQLIMIDAIEDLAEDMNMKIGHTSHHDNDTSSLLSSKSPPPSYLHHLNYPLTHLQTHHRHH
ncbi:unnamed protein product [Cunninghamella blakesleeana]